MHMWTIKGSLFRYKSIVFNTKWHVKYGNFGPITPEFLVFCYGSMRWAGYTRQRTQWTMNCTSHVRAVRVCPSVQSSVYERRGSCNRRRFPRIFSPFCKRRGRCSTQLGNRLRPPGLWRAPLSTESHSAGPRQSETINNTSQSVNLIYFTRAINTVKVI